MEHPETSEDCYIEIKNEVIQEEGNDDLEDIELDEIAPPAQMILNIKNEENSDEEELEQPAQVTIEAFKEEVPAGYGAKLLPAVSIAETSVSLPRSQTSFQWEEQGLLSRQISCNKQQVQVDGKGVLPNSAPSVGCQWIAAGAQNFAGALIKDAANVQYVLVKPVDQFYSVKSGNNTIVVGSSKNIARNISTKMTATVAIGNNSAESEVVEIPVNQDKIVLIPTGSSNKRSSESVTALRDFGLKQTDILRKKKKTETQSICTSEPECVKIACDVNSCLLKCTTVFNKDERSKFYRAFLSLSTEDQKKFIMQCCRRKICLRTVKESNNSTSDMNFEEYVKYDFLMRSVKGVPVQVCKLFFASILGFTDNYFNSYLSDMYKNANSS